MPKGKQCAAAQDPGSTFEVVGRASHASTGGGEPHRLDVHADDHDDEHPGPQDDDDAHPGPQDGAEKEDPRVLNALLGLQRTRLLAETALGLWTTERKDLAEVRSEMDDCLSAVRDTHERAASSWCLCLFKVPTVVLIVLATTTLVLVVLAAVNKLSWGITGTLATAFGTGAVIITSTSSFQVWVARFKRCRAMNNKAKEAAASATAGRGGQGGDLQPGPAPPAPPRPPATPGGMAEGSGVGGDDGDDGHGGGDHDDKNVSSAHDDKNVSSAHDERVDDGSERLINPVVDLGVKDGGVAGGSRHRHPDAPNRYPGHCHACQLVCDLAHGPWRAPHTLPLSPPLPPSQTAPPIADNTCDTQVGRGVKPVFTPAGVDGFGSAKREGKRIKRTVSKIDE